MDSTKFIQNKFLSPGFEACCPLCLKYFKSAATLEAHCHSQRHQWNLMKCYERKMEGDMLSSKGGTTTVADPAATKAEALSCLNHDIKKAMLLLCKAGKGFLHGSQTEEARTCLLKAIELSSRLLQANSSDNKHVFGGLDGNNNTNISDEFTLERGIPRGSRLKRQKMENISKLCKSLQRGSADLFKTMVQCYEESFDIKIGDDESLDGKRNSLKKTEVLLNRDLVLKELADTERSYVDSLEYLVTTILPAFENCDSDALREANPGIFCNIKEIYKWHSSVFVDKIEDCLEDHELLGPTFKEHEDQLTSLYETYCQNKPHADDLLADLGEEIDQVFQNLDTNFSILDYLIKPVQRVMKYQLLLHSIRKYTKKVGEDVSSIQDAFDVMEVVPQKVNDKMHLAMIIGNPHDIGHQNLIFQDTLEVAIDRGRAKPKKYRIFIFEEVVLMTETFERIGRLPQYRCIFEGKTHRMGITETVENHKLKFAIWFRKFKSSDIFVCTAETKELKDRWIKTINGVLNKQNTEIKRGPTHKEPTSPALRLGKSLRSRKSKSWSPDQLVKQATIGHPREGTMSMKLKENIHKFLVEEIVLMEEEKYNGDDVFSQEEEEYLQSLRNGTFTFNKESKNIRNRSLSNQVTSYRTNIHRNNHLGHMDEENYDFDNGYTNELPVLSENQQVGNTGFSKLHRSNGDFRNRTVRIDPAHQNNSSDKNKVRDKSKRSHSVPSLMKYTENDLVSGVEKVKTNLTESEIWLFQRILSESHFVLAQVEQKTSIEKACHLYDQSLSFFFDVQELNSIQSLYDDREDLLQKCFALYESLRSTENFGKSESDLDGCFYNYDGLFGLLTSYADLSAKDETSTWCIVLYSLAVISANIESKRENATTCFRKLGGMYKEQGSHENAVESFVDAHYKQLEASDVTSAAKDLAEALKIALLSGDSLKCKRLETMAMPLIHQNKEIANNSDVGMLKILAEMSSARRTLDYDWFCKHYDQLCTSEVENYKENQKSELNSLFMHLMDHLILKKQRKSGEVFV